MRAVDEWKNELVADVVSAFLDYEGGIPETEKCFSYKTELITRKIELNVSKDKKSSTLTVRIIHLE